MKFKEYIARNHVFTTDQVAADCELSSASVKTTLRRAIKAGLIERARRGVYVSRYGQFSAVGIDSFELASAVDAQAVFSFHSALEAHGVAHNVGSICQFRSAAVKSAFEYNNVSYAPYPSEPGVLTRAVRGAHGTRVLVTSREQTVVDCLSHPDRCGGIEEALMSVSMFPYVDVEALCGLVAKRTPTLAARAGWLLEQKAEDWRVSPASLAELERMAEGGPFRLDRSSGQSRGWSPRWKLCLPQDIEEVESWIQ